MILLKLNALLIHPFIIVFQLFSLGIVQIIHCPNGFEAWKGWHYRLHQGNMLHSKLPCLCIHHSSCEVAYAGNVEEEKDERFERHVSDTIIRPWAMMIHVRNASIALAAVMHAQHFECSARLALVRIFLRLTRIIVGFTCDKLGLLFSKMLWFDVSWISRWSRLGMTPVCHDTEECGGKHL